MNHILGRWKQIDPVDTDKETYIEFFKEGLLIYEDIFKDYIGRIQMTYKLNGNYILTNQPAYPMKRKRGSN